MMLVEGGGRIEGREVSFCELQLKDFYGLGGSGGPICGCHIRFQLPNW